jgi:hypothetical protein
MTSSVETFTAMYRFFTGSDPVTTDVVAQPGPIQLSGRVVIFPSNGGLPDATLDVYAVDPATGTRTGPRVATFALSGDGGFGPFTGDGSTRYEFAVTRDGTTHHHYFEPFRRTDRLIRILSNEPGTGVDALLERGPAHVTLLAYRNKEWWGDQGPAGDSLTVNGRQILGATTAPRARRAIGMFAYDASRDRRSDAASAPGLLSVLPFVSGSDVYVPSSPTASGTVVVESRQRGGPRTHRFAFPDFPSDTHMVTAYFDDFPQR